MAIENFFIDKDTTVDELAEIMLQKSDVRDDMEMAICRIAQKGRAVGIHLIITTQFSKKDVITGLIKANIPTKIAFRVNDNKERYLCR